ncbi:transglutaminaseTgpA domain-containing protein [Microbacterium karelineae]|uniref:transglutaminase family protein n=1 Tax=Microbacterium karelineae TaxID=2654283 RepID=UPI0012EA219A|nr:transglutaminase domain-containing protein [Microbacterium karelineae]
MSAPESREALSGRRWILDIVAMIALFTVPILVFWPLFGGARFFLGAYGGLVIGLTIAAAGALWRWHILVLTPVTIVVYFLFGGAFALPATTIAGVVPSLETLRQLAAGSVTMWKSFLTTVTPMAVEDGHLLVPFATLLVAAVVGGSLALRVAPAAWAMLPILASVVLAIVLGSPSPPAWLPYALGAAFIAVAIAWLAIREAWSPRFAAVSIAGLAGRGATGGAGTRFAAGIAIVAVAAGAGFASQAVAPQNEVREVARDTIIPPFRLHDYASPLQSWRSIVRDHPTSDEPLFSVAGLPEGARVRLAVLDGYDGLVYNVADSGDGQSSDFLPLRSGMAEGAEGTPVSVEISIEQYSGPWLPDLGVVDVIAFAGAGERVDELRRGTFVNEETGTALVTGGLRQGDRFTVSAVLPDVPTADEVGDAPFAKVPLPTIQSPPGDAASVAADIIDEADDAVEGALQPYARAKALEEWLQNSYFSHGLSKEDTGRSEDDPQSRAGHGAQRIGQLLSSDQRVGDDEQYAVAMAIMARALGMPARVVMGFHADENDPDVDPFIASGATVHAWVEVAFDGHGWVAFDPTPAEDNVPEEISESPRQEPRPQVLQPPPPPQEPADEPPLVPNEREQDEEEEPLLSPIAWQVIVVGGISLLAVALLLAPFLIVAAIKLAQRRRRLRAVDPSDRIAGGWHELVDRAADLGAYRGTALPEGATRHEEASTVASRFHEPRVAALAAEADARVFAPVDPTDEEVSAYWHDVDEVVGSMRQKSTAWGRFRARLSLRSIAKNSPIRRGLRRLREKVADTREAVSEKEA